MSFCSSFQPTTAASSTSGCEDSAASTSNGETYMPDTFSMSSCRPQHTKYPSASSMYLSPERVHSPWKVDRDFSRLFQYMIALVGPRQYISPISPCLTGWPSSPISLISYPG